MTRPSIPLRIAVASLVTEPEDWTWDALCVQVDGDVFFPEKGGTTAPAKRICRRCAVREECLAAGLHGRYGIWGGLSERERRALVRGAA
ncbi:WhiB family transcriptional regulator [Tsukamurella ocularis]